MHLAVRPVMLLECFHHGESQCLLSQLLQACRSYHQTDARQSFNLAQSAGPSAHLADEALLEPPQIGAVPRELLGNFGAPWQLPGAIALVGVQGLGVRV